MSTFQTNNTSWYAPLERETPRAAEPKKKKRLSNTWKAILGVVGALALIAGSSLLFSSGKEEAAPDHGGHGFTIPGPPAWEDPEGELPDDFREFFDGFFVPDDSTGSGEIRIPMAENVPDFELQFEEQGEELTLQELYESCARSIVSITGYSNESSQFGYYWGSGIVMSRDGLILTNTHLLEDCDSATVTLSDGSSFDALLVGADATSDIAVLKIDAKGLQPAHFADSATLRVGDRVCAIGNPLGEEFNLTLTEGIVSGLDRSVGQYGRNVTAIQNTAAINEGNSGGALLNMYGQVVGVTNMKMSAPLGEVSIEGMGLAVPSALAKSVADSLILYGEVRGRTALGITVGPIPAQAASHYDIPQGLYVSAVSENSDAAAQGVQAGDIMTAVNGEALTGTDQIFRAKDGLKVGDTIRFTFWRDGKSFDLDIALIDYNDAY